MYLYYRSNVKFAKNEKNLRKLISCKTDLCSTIVMVGLEKFKLRQFDNLDHPAKPRWPLDEKAAFNFQGTGAVQWIIGIPLMILPMAIFGLINWLIGFEIATATIAVMGFIGIALHKKFMAAITKKYITNKYVMIHAFKQEN